MKIKKITLKDIRCFEFIEIDFTGNEEAKDWIVVLGDNGVGKSTILRSIALGLTEESGAAGLLDELTGDWIRIGSQDKSGYIIIELEPFKGCKEEANIKTEFFIDDFEEVKVRQTVTPMKPKSFIWDDLFVCGYGTNRSGSATEEYREYTVTDAIYTQFKYSHKLQSPELIVRRLLSLKISEREIFSKLEHLMMLKQGSISMPFSGLQVDGPWGKKMPYGALGDGYRVVLSMFIDVFGWMGLIEGLKHKPNKKFILNVEGIIIIDELEQHLHPSWQKEIISLLRKEFPDVQFIVSTHSPLCVVGTTELEDDNCLIVALDRNEDNKVYYDKAIPPRGQRADQVLTSYLFDLKTSGDNKLRSSLIEYSRLYKLKIKTLDQKKRILELHNWLDNKVGSPETEFEKEVVDAVEIALNKIIEEKVSNKRSPINFEVLKHLHNLD